MNYWRLFSIIAGVVFFITGYHYGIWNSIMGAGFVFGFYQFGRFSYEHDLIKQRNPK